MILYWEIYLLTFKSKSSYFNPQRNICIAFQNDHFFKRSAEFLSSFSVQNFFPNVAVEPDIL